MRLRLKARTTWRATSANCIFFESISVCTRRPCENAPHARAVEWRSHQTSHKACGSRCSLRCKCFVRSACQIGGVQARHLDRLAHAADSVSLSDACSSNHRGVSSVLANASDPWSPCFVSLPPKSNCKKNAHLGFQQTELFRNALKHCRQKKPQKTSVSKRQALEMLQMSIFSTH